MRCARLAPGVRQPLYPRRRAPVRVVRLGDSCNGVLLAGRRRQREPWDRRCRTLRRRVRLTTTAPRRACTASRSRSTLVLKEALQKQGFCSPDGSQPGLSVSLRRKSRNSDAWAAEGAECAHLFACLVRVPGSFGLVRRGMLGVRRLGAVRRKGRNPGAALRVHPDVVGGGPGRARRGRRRPAALFGHACGADGHRRGRRHRRRHQRRVAPRAVPHRDRGEQRGWGFAARHRGRPPAARFPQAPPPR